jgi:hypothetical protein
VCGGCHALVHAEELERLANLAKAHEAQSKWSLAREEWLKTLELLPKDATQAEWVRAHAVQLYAQAAAAQTEEDRTKWARRFGPLAPIVLLLLKGKTLLFSIFKLKFLFSLFAFVGVYWTLFGMKFGIGFTVLILIHELGHYIDIKRRGLPAEMPVFLPSGFPKKRAPKSAWPVPSPDFSLRPLALCSGGKRAIRSGPLSPTSARGLIF